jgi:hypothetical protein
MAELKKLLDKKIQSSGRHTANPWQLHRQRGEMAAMVVAVLNKNKKREPERCSPAHSQTHALNW